MCILFIYYIYRAYIFIIIIFQFKSTNYQDFIGNYNNNEIDNLKDELSKANIIIEEQKSIINDLQNKLNKCNNYEIQINNLNNIIIQKDNEINNLKNQLNNINNISNNNISNNVNFNEIVVVNFISMDQNVHYAVAALKNNTFAEIEEKLYKQYPKYRETNNNFITNGSTVLRFKTIAENKISNGLPVTLIVPS